MQRTLPDRLRFAIAGLVLFFAAFPPNPSQAQNRILDCNEHLQKQTPQDRLVVRCELRLGEQLGVTKVLAGPGSERVEAVFHANNALTPAVPVIFLLDQSQNTIEKPAFARLKSVVTGVLDLQSDAMSFGMYAFTDDAKIIAPLGTAPATIKLALETVTQRTGNNELLRNINDLLPTLRENKAARKVLIVLSDGRLSDTAYSIQEIAKQLRDAGVTVFSVAPSRTPDDLTDAQGLRRLSDETFGEFLVAADRSSRDRAAAQLKAYLTSGGFIEFSPTAKDTNIDAELSDGKRLTATFSSRLWTPPSPAVVDEPAAKPPIVPVSDITWWRTLPGSLLRWSTASWLHAAAAGTIVLLFIALGWFAWRLTFGGRSAAAMKTATTIGAGPRIADLKPTLARFEFLDGESSSELIHAATTRIGRHGDNDIILKNTSVSRHHAILKHDPSGPFVLIDLDTENGVLVNEKPVKSAKLNDGDLVELGEVRMRFRVA